VTRTVYRTCTLCEATCGLALEVERGADGERVRAVRPDPDDPISKGYACPKGIAIAQVHHDPDRLRTPLRRTPGGGFEPISWDEALDEAAAGFRRVRERHGGDAIATYFGNPLIHNAGATLLKSATLKALGTHQLYGASSQDTSPRLAASYHLYGSSVVIPVPDIDRCDFFLCVGANPLVSNGSVMTAPGMRDRLRALRARGGRLVVIDPRRSETAKEADLHLPIRPGTDAALLLAMAALIVRRRGLPPELDGLANGGAEIERRLAALDVESCARFTGVPVDAILRLAGDFVASTRPVAYSRIGVCNARFGTLASYATDLLNVVAGRLGAVGGAMFATPAIDALRLIGLPGMDGHGRWRTRVRGLPETMGEVPAATFADEVETPGPGQLRALLCVAGNPVLSAPNGRRIARALAQLEFHVAIDLYVNETTRHANLILPPAWTLADEHVDFTLAMVSVRNAVRLSPKVVERGPDERHDWEILLGLVERLGGGPLGKPAADAVVRLAGRLGWRWTPRAMLDFLLRTGKHGDRYLPWRRGLSMAKLARAPHGIDLGPLEPGVRHRVQHRDRCVALAPPVLLAAWDELDAALAAPRPADELVLIGRRELRSNNSWMHNVPSLVSGAERCLLHLHPKDARARGIEDGDTAVLESRVHRGEVRVKLSDDLAPGVVSLPHGWGHAESAPWQRVAGARPGVSANDWTDDAEVESVVGQSILNGVPVRLSRRATAA